MVEPGQSRLSTGVEGLDEILFGGLVAGQGYLVSGGPGSGKTVLGLHFLADGAVHQEKSLYITLEETAAQIRRHATILGFDLDEVDFLDLSPDSSFFVQSESYDLFSPAEVERQPLSQKIAEKVEGLQPKRIFLDSMSQFRYLASDVFQFRKQVLSFLRYLSEKEITLLFSSEYSSETSDDDLRFMSDGIIELRSRARDRIVKVTKSRGSDFRRGEHTMRLSKRGMQVFPRLAPPTSAREFNPKPSPSGIAELDHLLHGGLERGTVTIISGPTGVGKTTLGMQFVREAAAGGEHSAVYTFEERSESIVHRCEGINMPLRPMLQSQSLSILQVEPLNYFPDEFAALVRRDVEKGGVRTVMIDSTAGYRLSFQDQEISVHLHALCKYLKNMGVTVLLTNEVEMIMGGQFQATQLGISYLADNIIYLRYAEIEGAMRKTVGVLKKRLSNFEKTLCQLEITPDGIKVGKAMSGFQGLLSGNSDLLDVNSK